MSYGRIEELLAAERCVILDGGVSTELQRLRDEESLAAAGEVWGSWALYRAPRLVREAHRRFAVAGADVLSTNTWSLLSSGELEGEGSSVAHWMDIARSAVRLAREAATDAGRSECAVAYSLSDDLLRGNPHETIELLRRVWEDDPPDLLLLETLTLVRDEPFLETVEELVTTGIPVWVSFRRCRHGVCGVYGEHWGPPEGDAFGRTARRLEEAGVRSLAINCLPADHVPGMLSWLRDFTDLPLGVYPNLGRLVGATWRFDETIDPQTFAGLARGWRDEGARVVGGCCGVTPDHIAVAAEVLDSTTPGSVRVAARPAGDEPGETAPEAWVDELGRVLYPLPFPTLVVDPGVFVPTQGSYLLWKHLFRNRIGENATCVDVGCGCGILAVQLARNGAERVLAVDIDDDAVANTIANAYRNHVSERVGGEAADLFTWEPTEQFDVVVASLYQMPVDPFAEASSHRPLDYWGRSLLDHFLRLLPRLLAPDGVAYVMQLSIVGQLETQRRLAAAGLQARVVDWSFFPFGPLFTENREQILRVEERSDAHHLQLGGEDVMVAYLLEVRAGGSAR